MTATAGAATPEELVIPDTGTDLEGRPADGLAHEHHAHLPQAALPVLFVALLLVFATSSQGAFAVSRWAPLALLCVAVLAGALVVPSRRPAISRPAGAMLAGIWGLTALSFASALWAKSRADAWLAGDRTLLYAAMATLPFVLPLRRRSLAAIGWAMCAGIGLVALYVLIDLQSNGPALFLAGRLNGPVNYRNATALLFAMPFWPFVIAAATRDTSRFLRAGAFALAMLCLGLAFLTQSRGIVLGVAVGGLISLTAGPDRIRRAWVAVVAVAGIALASPWLLKPFHAFDGGYGTVTSASIATAAHALLVLTLVGFLVGMAIALFDRGLRSDGHGMVHVRQAARATLIIGVVVGVLGGAAAVGNPVTFAHQKWDQFRSLDDTTPTGLRLTSTGGQRYDLWRVAVDEFRTAPLLGVGADNYEFGYYQLRDTNRNLNDPHSLAFALLSEDGLIGVGLFALFIGGAGWALRRGWGRLDRSTRRNAIAPAAAAAVLIGQSLVDWMWLIPGLTAIGILLLATAVAQARPPDLVPAASSPRRRLIGLPVRLGAASVLAVGAITVLALYLSDAYVQKARSFEGSPKQEYAAAHSAAQLNPWSVTPRYLEASALESMGKRSAALAALDAALRLEPDNFASLGVIGDFQARGGHLATARHVYREALVLNPLDTGLQQLSRIGEPAKPAKKKK